MKLTVIIGLTVALIGALCGWGSEYSRLKSTPKTENGLRKTLEKDKEMAELLNHQHAEDDAANQQLKSDLKQSTTQLQDLNLKAKNALLTLQTLQRQYAFVSAQLTGLQTQNDKTNLDESRYYQLYVAWKESGVDQREYINGLYSDDLVLRKEAKKAPYPAPTFTDPDQSMGTPIKPL